MSVLYSVELAMLPYNVFGTFIGIILIQYWHIRKSICLISMLRRYLNLINNGIFSLFWQ
ncbi:MAG: hypothetical protein ACP6IS_08645 [Candidatus Asgardarchaeia archaeon]